MAETSTIFGFMKYVSATDILSDFKKTVDSYFVNSLGTNFRVCAFFFIRDTFSLGEDYEVSKISERSRRCWKTKVK